jgi:hypothetical protein
MSEAMDPARLDGDALTRWYLRSPSDIEQERQAAAGQRYQDFFGESGGVDPDPGFDSGPAPSNQDVDSGFSSGSDAPGEDIDPGFTWVLAGPNRLRSVSTTADDGSSDSAPSGFMPADGVTLDRSGAGPNDGSQIFLASANAAPNLGAGPTTNSVSSPSAAKSGASTPTYRSPATPPPPSFFSSLSGGPAPLTSPEGNVIGYYDHQAAKAGLGLTAEYSEVAPLFQPGGWMDGLLENGGTRIAGAISDGIEEAIENHHAWPKFMGGPADQETIALRQSLHRGVHAVLHPALKDAGLLNVGGKGGATVDWMKHFNDIAGSREKAFKVLRSAYSDFDRTYGTAIGKHLEKVFGESKLPSNP